MLNSTKPSGRRPGPTDTRAAILAAARGLFAERGMDATSVRGVAARAGVDPSLVLHFFGSKGGLFDAVLEPPIDPEEVRALLAGPRSKAGERVVAFYVRTVFRGRRTTVASLLRSAVSDEGAAERLRIAITQGPLAMVEQMAGVPRVRLEMLASMMMGLFLAREILRIEPLASLDDDALIALYAPHAQRILVAPKSARAAPGPARKRRSP